MALNNFRKKTQLYCVGAAKTGTHSVSAMFDKKVRTQHEAEFEEVIAKILELLSGKINEQEIRGYIRKRDRRLRLEIDSSQLNFFLLDYLLCEFPNARFLLTIRDCYSWLDSLINDSLRRNTSENWIKLREVRFGANKFVHYPQEKILLDKGLYTLDGYLSYWSAHNTRVLETVPENNLLVIKTQDISQSVHLIADFANISRNRILKDRTHAFKNPTKYGILKQIDRDFLESKVNQHCLAIMKRFFPEIKSIENVIE